jgi:hypothetical protein
MMNTSTKMTDELLSHVSENSFVLEPSAGQGDIAARLVKEKKCKVDCVELNSSNISILINSHLYNNVYHGDFLKQTFFDKEIYDFVVAVPPYKNNIDCQHIMAMYDVVRIGGIVLSYTLPYWTTGMYDNQKNFRKWLESKDVRIKFFEDEDSYVGCPKALLIIKK